MAELTHTPTKGLLTFNSEGNNDPSSQWYSRRAHHPTGSSGVTIGRGYDMLHRSVKVVKTDLKAAGLSEDSAKLLSTGAGLSGKEADAFVKREDIQAIEITEEAQKLLFEIIYSQYESNARRICTKKKVQAEYGTCSWELMDRSVKELITDLLYRGDYTPSSRQLIQKALIKGDYTAIKAALDKLHKVPSNRKLKREQHLEKAKVTGPVRFVLA